MKIDKQDVLRYLSYKNQIIDTKLDLLIDRTIIEIEEYLKPRYTFRLFKLLKNNNEITLLNSTIILKGNAIANHLKYSEKCVVVATTIGSIIEQKIKYYQNTDLTKTVILDACATCAVESYTDDVEDIIKEEANKMDLGITYRYSPGYGDLSLDTQPYLIKGLEADKKIGLSVTENNILLPRKSVTAIIGFQDKNIVSLHPGCNDCSSREFCKFRKEGNYCGK